MYIRREAERETYRHLHTFIYISNIIYIYTWAYVYMYIYINTCIHRDVRGAGTGSCRLTARAKLGVAPSWLTASAVGAAVAVAWLDLWEIIGLTVEIPHGPLQPSNPTPPNVPLLLKALWLNLMVFWVSQGVVGGCWM